MAAMAALAARTGAAAGLRRRSAPSQEPARRNENLTSSTMASQLGGSVRFSLGDARRAQPQQLVAVGLSSRSLLLPGQLRGSGWCNDAASRTLVASPVAALQERRPGGPLHGGDPGSASLGEMRTEVIRLQRRQWVCDIADDRGVSLDTLQLLNPSLDLDFVVPGQELVVPLRTGLPGALLSLKGGAEDAIASLMHLVHQGSQALGSAARGLQGQGQGEGELGATLQAGAAKGRVSSPTATGSLRKRRTSAVWEDGVRQRQARAERRRRSLAGQGREGGTPGSRSARRASSSPEPEWRAGRRTPGGASSSRQRERAAASPAPLQESEEPSNVLSGIEFHVPQELQHVLADAGKRIGSASSAVQSELAQAASTTSQLLVSAATAAQKSVTLGAVESERRLAVGLARAQEGIAAGAAAAEQGLLAAEKSVLVIASALQERLAAGAKAAQESFEVTKGVTQTRAASAQQELTKSLGVAKEGLSAGVSAIQKELSSVAANAQQSLGRAVTEVQQGLQTTAVVAQKGAAVAQKEISSSLEVANQGLAAGLTAAQHGVTVGVATAQEGLSSSVAAAQQGIAVGVATAQESLSLSVTAASQGVAVGVATAQKGLSSSVSAAQQGLTSAVAATEELLRASRDSGALQGQPGNEGAQGAQKRQAEDDAMGVCVAPPSAIDVRGVAPGPSRSSGKSAQKGGLRQRKGKAEGAGKPKEGRSGRAQRKGEKGPRRKEQERALSGEEGEALEGAEAAQMMADESRRTRGRSWTLNMPFAAQEEPSGRAELEEYMVQPGDSLASIAARHGVLWQDLTALNELVLSDGSLLEIHVGQILQIPPRSSQGGLAFLPPQLRSSIQDVAAAASALLNAIPARVATMGAAAPGVPRMGARSQLVSPGESQSMVMWAAGLLVVVLGLAKVASRAFWGSARIPRTTAGEATRFGPRTVVDEAIAILPKEPIIISQKVSTPPAPAASTKPTPMTLKRGTSTQAARKSPASSTGTLPLQADMAEVLERAQLQGSAALSLGGLACAAGYGSSPDMPALAIDSACRGAAAGFQSRPQEGMEVLCLVSVVGCPGTSPWHQGGFLPQAQIGAQRDYAPRRAAYQAARGSSQEPEDVFQFPCLGLAYELLPICTMLGASLVQLDSSSPSRAPWWYPPAPPLPESGPAGTTASPDLLAARGEEGTVPAAPAQSGGRAQPYGPGFHASVLLLGAPDPSGKGGLLVGATASLPPHTGSSASRRPQAQPERLRIISAVDAASESLKEKLQAHGDEDVRAIIALAPKHCAGAAAKQATQCFPGAAVYTVAPSEASGAGTWQVRADLQRSQEGEREDGITLIAIRPGCTFTGAYLAAVLAQWLYGPNAHLFSLPPRT